jgi:hypothetical protein
MWLLHGTTRSRADRIVRLGPDLNFREPGDQGPPLENFSFCIEGHASALGQARSYGILKAAASEGGPVILAADIPEEIVEAAVDETTGAINDALARLTEEEPPSVDWRTAAGGVVQFDRGPALDALLRAWPAIPKEIRGVP